MLLFNGDSHVYRSDNPMVDNAPCLRMVERVGFHREGLLRSWELGRDGRPIDCVVWSVLRTDQRWDQLYMSEPGVVSS